MIQTPNNNVIVKVKSKYTDSVSKIRQLSSIQNLSSVDPSDLVNIRGEVVSIPKSIMSEIDYEGYSLNNIKVGDTAIFSYRVIFNLGATHTDIPVFKNRIWYKGEEFFLCDIRNLFAVGRGEEIIMLNGYVMTTEFEESKIVLPQYMRRIKGCVKAQVIHIGESKTNTNSLKIYQNDTVCFNPFIAQKYQIKDKKFCIISQNHILGKIMD